MTVHSAAALPVMPAPEWVPPNVTPAEFLLLCGVIAECGHRMVVLPTTLIVARWTYAEWVEGAKARGFSEERKLRDAMRAGRSTPRGLRLAAVVVSHFHADELPVLMERAALRNTAMANPSRAADQALRCSPQISRRRPGPIGMAETSSGDDSKGSP